LFSNTHRPFHAYSNFAGFVNIQQVDCQNKEHTPMLRLLGTSFHVLRLGFPHVHKLEVGDDGAKDADKGHEAAKGYILD